MVTRKKDNPSSFLRMSAHHIAVVTSICGGKDHLLEDQAFGSAKWIAFVDRPMPSAAWEIRPAYDRFKSPRRNSRIVKMLIHQFVDAEYSIWIDGNQRLHRPPEELIERFLAQHDLAAFKHPLRDCLYGEAEDCAAKRLDDPRIIDEQAGVYRERGFRRHAGLCECCVLIRRHVPPVARFNEAWWSEFCRHSARDQIAFPVAVDSSGVRLNCIEENRYEWVDGRLLRGGFLERTEHLTPQPEVLDV